MLNPISTFFYTYITFHYQLIISRYYALTDLVPAHFIAITLNPEMKFKYFENEWEERTDWIENAKDMVQRVWKTHYKLESHQEYVETRTPLAPPISPRQATSDSINASEVLSTMPNWNWKKRQKLIGDNRGELDRYLDRETEDDLHIGPLEYWIQHVNDIWQTNLA